MSSCHKIVRLNCLLYRLGGEGGVFGFPLYLEKDILLNDAPSSICTRKLKWIPQPRQTMLSRLTHHILLHPSASVRSAKFWAHSSHSPRRSPRPSSPFSNFPPSMVNIVRITQYILCYHNSPVVIFVQMRSRGGMEMQNQINSHSMFVVNRWHLQSLKQVCH